MNNFCSLIKQARELSNISQRELARKVGVTSAYISRIEAGITVPSEELVAKISTELDIDFYDIMASIGKIPKELQRYITSNPRVLRRLRNKLAAMDRSVR